MVQVNGFQQPGLRFVSPAGGLAGFRRQGMDQQKKGVSATFVGASSAAGNGATAISTPPGVLSGDVAFVLCTNFDSTNPGTPSGWTRFDYIVSGSLWPMKIFTKVLAGAESPSFVLSSGGAQLVMGVYRGATAINIVTFNNANDSVSTSITMPAVIPSANSRGFVAVIVDRDTAPAITPPVDWVNRQDFVSTLFSSGIGDKLSGYDGSPFTFTGMVAGNPNQGWTLELTG